MARDINEIKLRKPKSIVMAFSILAAVSKNNILAAFAAIGECFEVIEREDGSKLFKRPKGDKRGDILEYGEEVGNQFLEAGYDYADLVTLGVEALQILSELIPTKDEVEEVEKK